MWLYSTLLTSPLVATLGLSLTIPLAILADAVFHEVHLNAMFVTGTTMVFAAFIGMPAKLPATDRIDAFFQRSSW
jgi:solute carrier family 35 protein F5